MDPVTQLSLGGVAAQAFSSKKTIKKTAWFCGGIGGMVPDLDVLIRTSSDLLGHGDYHRHFTHSLVFIPLGGLIAALLVFLSTWIFSRVTSRVRPLWGKQAIYAAIIGCATHGLLDACTSYGTMLYWPFSFERVAWDFISIIDPLYTLPLILGLVFAAIRNSPVPARIALGVSLLYLGFGAFQHDRVMTIQDELARSRGHEATRTRAFPTLANLFLWRSVYENDGKFYSDSIRLSLDGDFKLRTGESIDVFEKTDLSHLAPHLENSPELLRRFDFFHDFSDGYTAIVKDPDGRAVIADVRYSFSSASFDPIWGIALREPDRDRAPTKTGQKFNPFEWISFRELQTHADRTKRLKAISADLFGDPLNPPGSPNAPSAADQNILPDHSSVN